MTQKDYMMLILLILLVVIGQIVRYRKQKFYMPITLNPKMENHVLNRKYSLHCKQSINYEYINRCYMIASLFSFLIAVCAFLFMGYLISLITFFAVYSLSYAFVTFMVGHFAEA